MRALRLSAILLPGRGLTASLLGTAALLLTYAGLVRLFEGRPVAELGRRRAPSHLAIGLLGGTTAFAAVLALLLASGILQVVALATPHRLVETLALLLFLAAMEEVAFRGILQRILEESLGTHLALVGSNTLFALAHLDNRGATALSTVNVALAGASLGLLFVLGRTLWLPIAAHLAWNAAQTVAGAAVSGWEDLAGAALRLAARGPTWLSGGEFGPEGSVVTLGVTVALAASLWGAVAARGQLLPPRWRRAARHLVPLARPARPAVTPS